MSFCCPAFLIHHTNCEGHLIITLWTEQFLGGDVITSIWNIYTRPGFLTPFRKVWRFTEFIVSSVLKGVVSHRLGAYSDYEEFSCSSQMFLSLAMKLESHNTP